jgi:molybdopterin-guanine dinucleotide biosynthesis protein A
MMALVLAGAAGESELTSQAGVKNKSFIPLGGKTVLAYILEALTQVEEVSGIIVVGPVADLIPLQKEYSFEIVPEEGSIAKNIYAPYHRGLLKGPFLLVTGDIPLITRESMEDFLKQCSPYDLDFYYPIISKETIMAHYPTSKRTYVPLKEGTFTGGNIFIARAEKIEECLPKVEDFIRLRKSFSKMVSKLGITFLLKYVTHQLVVEDLIQRFRVLFGVEARAILTDYAEIGTDLDKVTDLVFFQQQLGQ